MIKFVLESVFVLIFGAIIAVVIKAYISDRKVPYANSNVEATGIGIKPIKHENSGKKVSESIGDAKKALEYNGISDFNIMDFYGTLS